MSDLFQDIDEAIRREKAEQMWRENGAYLIGAAVLLVLLTGVFTAWNSWQMKKNMAQTSILVTAMESKTPDIALTEAAKGLNGTHKSLALLQTAGMLAQKDKIDEAAKLYQDVAADASAPAVWRDLAKLMSIRLEWNNGVDETKAKELYAALKPIMDKNSPWHLHATVQAAMILGDNLSDYKGAIDLLSGPLADGETPQTLREQAKSLDHLYAMKLSAIKPVKADKSDPEAAPKG